MALATYFYTVSSTFHMTFNQKPDTHLLFQPYSQAIMNY